MNWTTAPAHEIVAAIEAGDVTARAVTEASLERARAVEPAVHSFLLRLEDRALQRADAVDAQRKAGEPLPPLAGAPLALKDNMAMRGVETTCASKILAGWKPPYDATVVRRLEEAGAVIVGKANMDEFAMGSSTENSAYSVTRNPWDVNHVPGGSSGGSAAAVAAGEAAVALGSDTGGSIRQPASFCGVVGVKPTYGRVSRYGLVAFASSLDQIGPLTRDVEDAALLLNAISGRDPLDSTSVDVSVPDFRAALTGDVRGLTIGKPAELYGDGLEDGTRLAVEAALQRYVELGAKVVDVSLPYLRYSLPVYYIIAPSEASSNLARYDGVRYGHRTDKDADLIEMYLLTRQEGFGAEVKRRIMIGTYCLSSGYYDAWYKKAQQVRTLIRRDFDAAFDRCDVLMTPTSPIPAFGVGEKTDDPYQMWLADVCTIPVNLAGLPGMALPCGFSGRLPVGLQIIAKPFDEETMLRAAHAYEQTTDWHKMTAPCG
ncbi:MAG TPA: Asp-tRNA(Asn)/Glu-tRNA(Gln) amidotransferase subunit GatA [Armatimonadota bacterium]|jgi:aspartyl-tRNA(Asn)/glutamyl-tRNA(Gln) amidotransferase subunit A